ncbi:SMP-30/gluconolactonase/LRE family protein [Angustibacter sp. McL0619]|uniref:SMP-30/gluconolactonase/LRE family protein n=1 Tax=Angustibacter sp. McL0619 TaxID=3415676 RepID=UPI003CE72F3E
MTRAEQVTGVCTLHGEGAVWSDAWGGLRFVDMLAGDVLTLAPGGQVTRLSVGRVAACVRPRAGGGMVVAHERGVALYAPEDTLDWSLELWTDPGIRMNEGSCDPDGRFWCASTAYDERTGAGTLYRLDADRSVTAVRSGFTIPNGLAFSPDGRLAYHAESATQQIVVYDYDAAGGLHDGRPFVRVAPEVGTPDGLAVDADGNVWTAIWSGGQVRCYTPSGELVDVVEVAARQATSCAFGGPDLRDLYITTSRKGLGDAAEPGAGALYLVRAPTAGQPVLPFAG